MKNKIKNFIALTAMMAIFGSQVQAQGYDSCPPTYDCCAPADDCCEAYCDAGRASYLSAALPIGALVIAGVIIATTRHHHHHSSSSTCCPRPCPTCPTFVHAH